MKLMNLLLLCIGTFIIVGCSKENKVDATSVFVDPVFQKNDLDLYIERTFTEPYNIEILYKYVDKESDLNFNLVPASYDGSVRMTKLFYYLGVGPYDELTGSRQFIRDNFARLINYIGNVGVRNNGELIAGTAESGTKITLYNVISLNAISGTNAIFLNESFFKTIHHEFQHILNQRKPFPASFNEVSGVSYVESAYSTVWTTTNTSLSNGFITDYSSKSAVEDFAEMYSFYVTRPQADFDAIVNGRTSTVASRTLIQRKLIIVKAYMQDVWNIDIDNLRAIILNRYANLPSYDQTNLN